MTGKLKDTVRQKVVLSAADPIAFVEEFERIVLAGARYTPGTFPGIRQFPPRVEFYVEGPSDQDDWLWQSTAYLTCFGVDVTQFIYSEEDLAELSWADFRKVCSAVGVKGRDRTKMTKEYLAAVSPQATIDQAED